MKRRLGPQPALTGHCNLEIDGTRACSLLTEAAEAAAKRKNVNKRSLPLTSRQGAFIALYVNRVFLSAAFIQHICARWL